VKSCRTDQFNHAPAQIFMNCGFAQPGRPSIGSWVTYVRVKYRAGTLSPERISQLESFTGWTWGPCKPGPSGNPDRDNAMVQARQVGRSLQNIGDEYGLSRQRVHQILNRMGYKEPSNA
jgi:hypothetical protein